MFLVFVIVFWFVQVENLKAIHPDYASRVQKFLDKYNEEAEKVKHALSCTLFPFLCFRGFFVECVGNDKCCTNLPLRNFDLYRMPTYACTPVQEHLPWLHRPRCDGFKIPPMTFLQMHLSATATNSNRKTNLPPLPHRANLILSWVMIVNNSCRDEHISQATFQNFFSCFGRLRVFAIISASVQEVFLSENSSVPSETTSVSFISC